MGKRWHQLHRGEKWQAGQRQWSAQCSVGKPGIHVDVYPDGSGLFQETNASLWFHRFQCCECAVQPATAAATAPVLSFICLLRITRDVTPFIGIHNIALVFLSSRVFESLSLDPSFFLTRWCCGYRGMLRSLLKHCCCKRRREGRASACSAADDPLHLKEKQNLAAVFCQVLTMT